LGWWKKKRSCGVSDDRLVALGRTALAMVMKVVFVSLAIGLRSRRSSVSSCGTETELTSTSDTGRNERELKKGSAHDTGFTVETVLKSSPSSTPSQSTTTRVEFGASVLDPGSHTFVWPQELLPEDRTLCGMLGDCRGKYTLRRGEDQWCQELKFGSTSRSFVIGARVFPEKNTGLA
jgi:hypothetical protein